MAHNSLTESVVRLIGQIKLLSRSLDDSCNFAVMNMANIREQVMLDLQG